jgi:hypothetical protein
MRIREKIYDENETDPDEASDLNTDANEAGFSIIAAEDLKGGRVVDTSIPVVKKIIDDGSQAVGSEIPHDEMTVMIDNAAVDGIKEGARLDLKIKGGSGAVYYRKKKIGDLREKFVETLKVTRGGQYAEATLKSGTEPYAVKLTFSHDKTDGVKIEEKAAEAE